MVLLNSGVSRDISFHVALRAGPGRASGLSPSPPAPILSFPPPGPAPRGAGARSRGWADGGSLRWLTRVYEPAPAFPPGARGPLPAARLRNRPSFLPLAPPAPSGRRAAGLRGSGTSRAGTPRAPVTRGEGERARRVRAACCGRSAEMRIREPAFD